MVSSGVTNRTTGSTLILGYLPTIINEYGIITDEMEAYGEEISKHIKIRDRRVRDQFWIDTVDGDNIDKIGLGLANIKRFEDNDTDYVRRIKSTLAFEGGGNVATLTGVSSMEQNTGSWFEWNVLRQECGDVICNRIGRCFGESGNATRIEFVTGNYNIKYPGRFHQEVDQFRALGTMYGGFGECIPSNWNMVTGSYTGGWYLHGSPLHNMTVTWDTGFTLVGSTGSINCSFDSFSYAGTGEMNIVHAWNTTRDIMESGHTMFTAWLQCDTTGVYLKNIKLFTSATNNYPPFDYEMSLTLEEDQGVARTNEYAEVSIVELIVVSVIMTACVSILMIMKLEVK